MNIYQAIHQERLRAHKLHGQDGDGMESDTMPLERMALVVGEEFGEVQKAILDLRLDGTLEELHAELVQLGAMTAAMADRVRREIGRETGDMPIVSCQQESRPTRQMIRLQLTGRIIGREAE